ncbi:MULTISPECIES: hypothetical protein [unclassified Microcystis]|uniref:hypothetical protein n=1 Tax=unclassified Microcystis TaxID=2643300 RepID=UPI0022BC9A8C|nr:MULTISPECIES: hypothetical protein [unclassified Microcystis]MCA2693190.1 hypothetical protein [Microcystis sp. M034S2]MCA2751127.1 hypothetical protein [Microcystis sp. M144S2]MCZ8202319.1 hypothetical protein [Microcystis sp. LE19-55.1A]MCZ8302130.1 hypothetical protein [Beijerinckiaceae bacterium]
MSRSFQPLKKGCPICNGARRDCRQSLLTNLIHCRDMDANPPDYIHRGIDSNGFNMWAFKPDADNWNDEKRREYREQREREKQLERERHARSLSPIERDREIKKILNQLTLSDSDRILLKNREYLTDDRIANFRTVEQWQKLTPAVSPGLSGVNWDGGKLNNPINGIMVPIPDHNGLFVSLRLYNPNSKENDTGKYIWLSSRVRGVDPKLQNGELPIAIYWPSQLKHHDQIGICEGLELKPAIAADRLGIPFIGASGGNFAGSKESLLNAIKAIKERLGNPSAVATLYPDAGSLVNENVTNQYRKLSDILPIQIAYWGHGFDKKIGDIDEIGNLESIEFITPSQFFELAKKDLSFWEKVKRLAFKDRKKTRKPLPSPLPTKREAKIYDRSNRLNEWASGKYILDTSPTGSGKSYDAGKATPEMMGVTDLFYITSDPRNVSTPTLKDWPILEGRHAGLSRNPLGEVRTRKRKDSLDRYQEKDLRANCARPFTHAALANQNISHGIESSTICKGCQFLELCRSGKGDYDYLQKRAIALQSKRLIAHPASLPNPKSYDPENGFDYGNTTLIFEESELSCNTTKIVKVGEKDITASIAALAKKDNDLFLSLRSLLDAVEKLLSEKQSNRYGFDGKTLREKLLGLIPSNLDLNRLKEALTPDLSFLDPISEMGESIADMPASVRKAFAEKDSNLAEKAENQALKQWLPELINALQGKGYLSLNHGVLSVSFLDSRLQAIINEAAKVIFLSATESIENLEARTGLKIDLITTGGGIPENIRFIQVSDLGRNGISRGNQQKRMVKAILDYYRQDDPDNTAFIRFQSHCKDDGDETSLRHFVNSQGTNAIDGVTRLIIDGLPCHNLESLRHDYAIGTGNDPYGEGFNRYVHHQILRVIKQETGRPRANLYRDRIFEIVLLTDYDFSGLIPPNQIKQCKAHEITPLAESVSERTKRLIGEAANRLWESGQKITERAISTVTGMARTTVNRCREFLDEILATFTIKDSYSNCGQAETLTQTDTDLINDATVYLEAASEDSLLTEFGNILEVLDRNQWAALWGFIPIPIRDKLLNQLLAIAT